MRTDEVTGRNLRLTYGIAANSSARPGQIVMCDQPASVRAAGDQSEGPPIGYEAARRMAVQFDGKPAPLTVPVLRRAAIPISCRRYSARRGSSRRSVRRACSSRARSPGRRSDDGPLPLAEPGGRRPRLLIVDARRGQA